MHTFIDESGIFVPKTDGSRIDCVAALVIPSARLASVEVEYANLKVKWGIADREAKGSKLSESQASEVIELLAKHEVIVNVSAIDMGTHSDVAISKFKAKQAEMITAQLTPQPHPEVALTLHDLQAAMFKMPNQLFVQIYPHVELLKRVLQYATLYYCQRQPEELGAFTWVVDAKDIALTNSERLYYDLTLPFLVNRYSLLKIDGGNYSYLDRFLSDYDMSDDYWRGVGVMEPGPHSGFDARKIFHSDFSFRDSKSSTGLQLVDLVAAIFQRAMNGKLQESGWGNLGRLFLYRRDATVQFVRLDLESENIKSSEAIGVARQRHAHVVSRIEEQARSILL